ncbi:MAG: plastocyanin/azurin family copper-binding protein [Acidimicrobiia bacterium]|nr:MAG: plastocyanin/azurin family copper-binding protein [Acidimicrobiia bacterium]
MFFSLRQAAPIAVAAALLLAACSDSGAATTTTISDDHPMEFGFGEPADAGDADRVVEIVASDDFRFTPDAVTVDVGETITFRIVNAGQVPHDFTLGDQATQDEHDEEMAEMGGMMMDDEANAVAIAAGETKELTWRFTEEGPVLIGCHQPGHYAAGMKGTVTVGS